MFGLEAGETRQNPLLNKHGLLQVSPQAWTGQAKKSAFPRLGEHRRPLFLVAIAPRLMGRASKKKKKEQRSEGTKLPFLLHRLVSRFGLFPGLQIVGFLSRISMVGEVC